MAESGVGLERRSAHLSHFVPQREGFFLEKRHFVSLRKGRLDKLSAASATD
jgi:hypothetical protein